ncbi:SPT3 Dosage dependent suppressor of Ty-induced promoter mutations-like protein [Neurospora sp. IMI 360204]|nr:SPT3 Dosage dependent suppressor of Ty-induced promoter mutations-like protein [Neurospora sp. IMI 360204]
MPSFNNNRSGESDFTEFLNCDGYQPWSNQEAPDGALAGADFNMNQACIFDSDDMSPGASLYGASQFTEASHFTAENTPFDLDQQLDENYQDGYRSPQMQFASPDVQMSPESAPATSRNSLSSSSTSMDSLTIDPSDIKPTEVTPAHTNEFMASPYDNSPSPVASMRDALSPQNPRNPQPLMPYVAPEQAQRHYSMIQPDAMVTDGPQEQASGINMATAQHMSQVIPGPVANLQMHGLPTQFIVPPSHWPAAFTYSMPHMPDGRGISFMPHGMPMNIPQMPSGFGGPPYHLDVLLMDRMRKKDGSGNANGEVEIPKMRVETQAKYRLALFPLPHGVKKLHLPTQYISKVKQMARPLPPPSPERLELHAVVVCTSAMENPDLKKKALMRARLGAQRQVKGEPKPDTDDELPGHDGGDIRICQKCIRRESKRAGRKKVKNVEEDEYWRSFESDRIIVFNAAEIQEWHEPKPEEVNAYHVEFYIRIACYGRHHNDKKKGFQVIFTIVDHEGNYIAQQLSSPIVITDDHKTRDSPQVDDEFIPDQPQNGTVNPPASNGRPTPPPPSHEIQPLKRKQPTAVPPVAVTTPNQEISQPPSPIRPITTSSKKRRVGNLTMTPVEPIAPMPLQQVSNAAAVAKQASSASSAFVPPVQRHFSRPSDASQQQFNPPPLATGAATMSYTGGSPPSTDNNDQAMFTLPGNQGLNFFANPTSGNPSRAQSPSHWQNTNGGNLLSPLMRSAVGSPFATAPAPAPAPVANPMPSAEAPVPVKLFKVIPHQGSVDGGFEVTVLGGGFSQGIVVMFGGRQATTTTYWGAESLVCLVPPSDTPGKVQVTFKNHQVRGQPVYFEYIDTRSDELAKSALACLAQKMGKDVNSFANDLIQNFNTDSSGSSASGAPTYNHGHFENYLLNVIEAIDLDDTPNSKPKWNLPNSATGKTMLHLACSLGLRRFTAGLLARGANPDSRDNGGYTPLHMASLNGHAEIVRLLIAHGADHTLRTLSGFTAADVAKTTEVAQRLATSRLHSRSRSLGSLPSRATSTSSFTSLQQTTTAMSSLALERPVSESTEPEDSSEFTSDVEDSSEDSESTDGDDEPVLEMRRNSIASPPAADENVAERQRPLVDGLGPAAAVNAIMAQIQQLQQTAMLHFQNFPQLPFMLPPVVHYMPALPGYQTAQRLAATVVPGITGPRPEPKATQTTPPPPASKESAGWFNRSNNNNSVPPPSYDESCGKGQSGFPDEKQASIAMAAAEAAADEKCAAMFDQAGSSSMTIEAAGATTLAVEIDEETEIDEEVEVEASPELPVMLEIGRKNAITKEQQENLRRAHSVKKKELSRDRNLYLIWIPLLLVTLFATVFNEHHSIWHFLQMALEYLFGSTQPLENQAPQTVIGQSQPLQLLQEPVGV